MGRDGANIADVLEGRSQWAVECVDCIDGLRSLPAGCAQTCVTSPPYFALRSYLPADHPDKAREIGSEPTPEAFIETMVRVFREVRRVLHETGTLWLNLGDSYASTGGSDPTGSSDGAVGRGPRGQRQSGTSGNILNMPHRVASALQADGWYWRQTIVWAKPSPMPESIAGWRWEKCRVKVGSESERAGQSYKGNTPDKNGKLNRDCIGGAWVGGPKWKDCPGCPKCIPNGGLVLRRGKWRCTTAHEYLFLFSKSEVYFCDQMAALEKANPASMKRQLAGFKPSPRDDHNNYGDGFMRGAGFFSEHRNPRSVWTITSQPLKEKHFAAYPPELVRRCLAASTSANGCCPECRMPVVPIVERSRVATRPGLNNKIWKHSEGDAVAQRSEASPNLDPQRHVAIRRVIGWRPTCEHGLEPVSHICIDPFSGAGTTVMVAKRLGLRGIGFDLNPEYVDMSRRRIETDKPRTTKINKRLKPAIGQREMF